MARVTTRWKKAVAVTGVCVTLLGATFMADGAKADGPTYPGWACTGAVSQNFGAAGEQHRVSVDQGGDTSYYYETWDHWMYTGPNGRLQYDHSTVMTCP